MKSLNEIQEQQLIYLYDAEWSITELAQWFRCARSLVKCILREHSLVVESRQKAPGGPWLCSFEVVDMSPTGQSLHWKALDMVGQPVFKGRHQASLTRREAVDLYQRIVLVKAERGYLLDNCCLRRLVRLIVQSEALVKESVEN